MGTIVHLPQDLIIDILSRLPVASLIRFKCVEKPWYDLIQSQLFVKTQLRNHVYSNNSSICLLVKSTIGYRWRWSRRLLSLLTYDRKRGFSDNLKKLYPKFGSKFGVVSITANSDGVICLYNNVNIYIANPSIRKSQLLPRTSLGRGKFFTENVYVGAGFDLKTNDFKIVRVFYIVSEDKIARIWKQIGDKKAEIYTLSSNCWREIEFPKNFELRVGVYDDYASVSGFTRLESYCNGVYNWIVSLDYGESGFCSGILSFDMSDEVFLFRTLPKFLNLGYGHIDIGFLEYNGGLVLISYNCREEEKCFDIWALDEFRMEWKLTKLFSVGPLSGIQRPLMLLDNNQLLLVSSNYKQVVSFNIITKQMNRLPIYFKDRSDQVLIYKRSLLFSV